jgi:hypothetical protein
MSSGSREGKSRRISSCGTPSANIPRTSVTRMRNPRIQGRPPHLPGSTVMRSKSFVATGYPNAPPATSPRKQLAKQRVEHARSAVALSHSAFGLSGVTGVAAAGRSAPRRRTATPHIQPRVTLDTFVLQIQHEVGWEKMAQGSSRLKTLGCTAPLRVTLPQGRHNILELDANLRRHRLANVNRRKSS